MLCSTSVATRRLTASMSMCQVKMVRLAAWSALRGRSWTGNPSSSIAYPEDTSVFMKLG